MEDCQTNRFAHKKTGSRVGGNRLVRVAVTFESVTQHPRTIGGLRSLEGSERRFFHPGGAYRGSATAAGSAGVRIAHSRFVAAFFIDGVRFAGDRVHQSEVGGEDQALGDGLALRARRGVIPFGDGAELAEISASLAGEIVDWHDVGGWMLENFGEIDSGRDLHRRPMGVRSDVEAEDIRR